MSLQRLKKYIFSRGQNLIEVIIAMALFAIFVTGFLVLGFRYWDATRRAMDFKVVQTIMQEAFDAVQSIEYNDFANLANGTYGLDFVGGTWTFVGGSDQVYGKYTRVVTISDINRDDDCNIVTSDGDSDPDTKAVTIDISWDDGSGAQSQSFTRHYTNWSRPLNCTSLPPGVVDVLGCAGLTQSDLPAEIIGNLIAAETAGQLICIEGDTEDNIHIPSNGAALTARNTSIEIDGNISGTGEATLVLGYDSWVNVTGNVNNLEYVVYGDGTIQDGYLNNAGKVWFLGTNSINGTAHMEEIVIESNANVTITGNVDFDVSLAMEELSTWDIEGKLNCADNAVATIDPTAEVDVDGDNKCGVVPE